MLLKYNKLWLHHHSLWKLLSFVFIMAIAREISWRSLIFLLLCNETFQWPRIFFSAYIPCYTLSNQTLYDELAHFNYCWRCILSESAKVHNLGPIWAVHSPSLQQYVSWPDSVELTKVCISLGLESIFNLCLLLCGAVLIKSKYEK